MRMLGRHENARASAPFIPIFFGAHETILLGLRHIAGCAAAADKRQDLTVAFKGELGGADRKVCGAAIEQEAIAHHLILNHAVIHGREDRAFVGEGQDNHHFAHHAREMGLLLGR